MMRVKTARPSALPRLLLGASLLAAAGISTLIAPVRPTLGSAIQSNCDIADDSGALSEQEAAMFGLINQYRADLGLPAMTLAPTLQRVAGWKAEALQQAPIPPVRMADHDDGFRSWDQRFIDCGYPATANFAENLGTASAPLEFLLEAWKQSPTHDSNLRDPRWSYFGIAQTTAGNGEAIWATTFGDDPR